MLEDRRDSKKQMDHEELANTLVEHRLCRVIRVNRTQSSLSIIRHIYDFMVFPSCKKQFFICLSLIRQSWQFDSANGPGKNEDFFYFSLFKIDLKYILFDCFVSKSNLMHFFYYYFEFYTIFCFFKYLANQYPIIFINYRCLHL